MSPISSNLVAESTHALTEALHLSETQSPVDAHAPAHPATTTNPEPASGAASSMASIVPTGGLHPIAGGQTSSGKEISLKVISQAVQVVAGALRDEFNLIAGKMAVKAFRDAAK